MSVNRIAIYGHRGWASVAILAALVASGAPIRVLYQPGSDISNLPESVTKVEVDVADQDKVIAALQNIDIVISLVDHEDVARQLHLVTAIPKTNVKLFIPSNLAAHYDEQGTRIPVNRMKKEVENAAQDAGIPMTIVLPGNFAEFALGTPAMGVDYRNNRIIFTGNSAHEVLNLCTRFYVAVTYASIFACNPIERIQNRTLALCEFRATGIEIAGALTKKFDSRTLITSESIESIDEKIETALKAGSPFALAYYYRKIWGTGQQATMVGGDIWDLKGYLKATLHDLIVGGQLQSYRPMPREVVDRFMPQFEKCI